MKYFTVLASGMKCKLKHNVTDGLPRSCPLYKEFCCGTVNDEMGQYCCNAAAFFTDK